MLTIAAKELLYAFRSVRFTIIVLMCCLLMPVSVAVTSSEYRNARADFNSRVMLEKARSTELDNDISVYRPVPWLFAFYKGVHNSSVDGVTITDFSKNDALSSTVQSPVTALFPMIDLRFMVGFVLGALAILISFDAINGEKETGTLKQLLTSSRPRSSLYIGKWLGLTTAVILPFLVGILINLIVFTNIIGTMPPAVELTAYIIAALYGCLYISLYVALGLLISAATHSTSMSIVVGLSVWGFLTVFMPNAMTVVSEIAYPTPTTSEVERNLSLKNNEGLENIQKTNRLLAEELKQDNSLEESHIRMAHRRNEYPLRNTYNMLFDEIELDYWREVQAQEGIGSALSLISPLGWYTDSTTILAATDSAEQWRFLYESYRWGARYFNQLYENVETPLTQSQLSSLREYQFQPASLLDRLGRTVVPGGSLLLHVLLYLFAGFVLFSRYDPR